MPEKMYVVIATHGRPRLLSRALDSVSRATRPDQFREVIVVENGSNAGASDVCRYASKMMPIRYKNLDQPGKSRALQSVIETLGNALVILLDDDVRVDSGLLIEYAAAAERNGRNCLFGGPVSIDYAGAPPPDWLHLPRSVRGWHPMDPDKDIDSMGFLGCNYAVYANEVVAVGGFNHNIGPGAVVAGTHGNPAGQETELQFRLMQEGCDPVYVADARVWHWVPKERCTPTWALHRRYRTSLTRGLQSEEVDAKYLWFGAPRWMWKAYLLKLLTFLFSYTVSNDQRKHKMRLPFYEIRGLIAGFRKKARLQ